MDEVMRKAAILLVQGFVAVLWIRWLIKERRRVREEKRLKLEGWEQWSSFKERGYTVVAYLPTRFRVPLEFLVKVYRGNNEIKEFRSPMTYEPRFGPDAGDVAVLEERVDKVLKELP